MLGPRPTRESRHGVQRAGVNYLTRTGGLSLALIGRSGVVLVDLPVMYAYGAN
jgi:hypothetical protein